MTKSWIISPRAWYTLAAIKSFNYYNTLIDFPRVPFAHPGYVRRLSKAYRVHSLMKFSTKYQLCFNFGLIWYPTPSAMCHTIHTSIYRRKETAPLPMTSRAVYTFQNYLTYMTRSNFDEADLHGDLVWSLIPTVADSAVLFRNYTTAQFVYYNGVSFMLCAWTSISALWTSSLCLWLYPLNRYAVSQQSIQDCKM